MQFLDKWRKAYLLVGAMAATMVTLEMAGVADIDAPIDHIHLLRTVRLEVFQLILWALGLVLIGYGQLRLWLWTVAPLIGADERIYRDDA